MKKKNSVILCLLVSVFLASCGGNKHMAKSEWTFDNTQHWHECDTKGHDDKLDVASHNWNDGLVTKDPTEESKGEKTFTCTVCGATKTEPIEKLAHTHTFDMANWETSDTHHWHKATCSHTEEVKDKAAHTFSEWTVKTAANIHTDRVEQRTCSVCEYTEERTITGTAIHDPDCENIKSDATNHWFECECGEKVEIEAHTYGDYSEKTPAGVDQDKQYSRKCSVCQHEDVLTFENTKTNGTYCVVVTDSFIIRGSKFLAVNVLRGTITTGDNLQFDGIDGEFSIDEITKNKIVVVSASCGESVYLQISSDSGNLDEIDNTTVGGRLAYLPESVKNYNSFTAMITFVESEYSKKIFAGRKVQLDLYNTEVKMISYSVALPEGVQIAEDNKPYTVTISLPNNASRALWAGTEFTYKIYDSASSSYIVVATGIALSVTA